MRKYLILLVIFLFSCTNSAGQIMPENQFVPQHINWHPYSEQSFQNARMQDKLILLLIISYQCHACLEFYNAVLTKEKVIKRLNDSFITFSIDNMNPNMMENVERFGEYHGGRISMVPAMFLIEPKSGISLDISSLVLATFPTRTHKEEMFLEMLDVALLEIADLAWIYFNEAPNKI